jgi:hypothetical protein
MLSLRAHAIICACLFAALIGLAILGNVLQAAGMKPLEGRASIVALSLFFALFVAAGMSAIPVMVRAVLGVQERLGNQNAPVIGAMIRHQAAIVWVLWGVIFAGTLVAIPAMIANGFFGAGSQQSIQQAINALAEGPNLGQLSARPDMSVPDMVKQSTMKLDTRYARSAIAGGGVFDYAIPGTGMVFPHARYYFITTYNKDPARIRWLTVGTSPHKVSRAELDLQDAALRARLIKDGWLAGHEVYRDEEDQALHGGATEGPEGRSWLKDGMVLDIEGKRMDEEKPGDDPKISGEWIQFIEVWPEKELPGLDRLVFRPARETGK